jgi:hypothetical protein
MKSFNGRSVQGTSSGVAVPEMRKVVAPPMQKAVVQADSAYVHAQERGDAYNPDPGVREAAWRAVEGAWLAKSRASTGGVTAGQLAWWRTMARNEPDPGTREALWAAIREAEGGAA